MQQFQSMLNKLSLMTMAMVPRILQIGPLMEMLTSLAATVIHGTGMRRARLLLTWWRLLIPPASVTHTTRGSTQTMDRSSTTQKLRISGFSAILEPKTYTTIQSGHGVMAITNGIYGTTTTTTGSLATTAPSLTNDMCCICLSNLKVLDKSCISFSHISASRFVLA